MILTVTPNPALDLTWHVDRLTVGETHRADAGAARAGGKGLNVARVAHAQGADVVAITTVGGRTGIEFAAELGAAGVPNALIEVAGATRQSIALVDEALGDTTIVNERGVNPADAEWAALLAEVVDRLPSARVLVISGSLPPGAPDSLLPILIGVGRDAGVPVIVDTSGPALLRAADAGASVLKPNAAELVEATGIADPVEGARSLIERGVELVLLSLGADGMLAIGASRSSSEPAGAGTSTEPADAGPSSEPASAGPSILHARLPQPLGGNPTGAGDAAVAACAVLLDAGVDDPEQILRRATAWSAAAVLMPLAGEIHPSWPDLEAALVVGPYVAETPSPARDTTARVSSQAEHDGSAAPAPPHDQKDPE